MKSNVNNHFTTSTRVILYIFCLFLDKCSRGEDCAYVFTFQATGCPNKTPTPKQMAWWRKQSANKVFSDMLKYCVKVRAGTAKPRQIRQCCGEGVECMPSSCKRQSTWVLSTGINALVCLYYILFRLKNFIIHQTIFLFNNYFICSLTSTYAI